MKPNGRATYDEGKVANRHGRYSKVRGHLLFPKHGSQSYLVSPEIDLPAVDNFWQSEYFTEVPVIFKFSVFLVVILLRGEEAWST